MFCLKMTMTILTPCLAPKLGSSFLITASEMQHAPKSLSRLSKMWLCLHFHEVSHRPNQAVQTVSEAVFVFVLLLFLLGSECSHLQFEAWNLWRQTEVERRQQLVSSRREIQRISRCCSLLNLSHLSSALQARKNANSVNGRCSKTPRYALEFKGSSSFNDFLFLQLCLLISSVSCGVRISQLSER